MQDILKALGIEAVNAGAWTGSAIPGCDGPLLDSHSPGSGARLAQVQQAAAEQYEQTAAAGHIKSDYYRLKLETWQGPGYDWHLTQQSFIVTPPDLASYSRQAQRLFPLSAGYDELARRGFEYMIAADWNYRTYLEGVPEDALSKEGLFYRDLFRKHEPVKVFSPASNDLAGPEISIFAIADD